MCNDFTEAQARQLVEFDEILSLTTNLLDTNLVLLEKLRDCYDELGIPFEDEATIQMLVQRTRNLLQEISKNSRGLSNFLRFQEMMERSQTRRKLTGEKTDAELTEPYKPPCTSITWLFDYPPTLSLRFRFPVFLGRAFEVYAEVPWSSTSSLDKYHWVTASRTGFSCRQYGRILW